MGRLTNSTSVRLQFFSNWKTKNNLSLEAGFIEDNNFSSYIELLCDLVNNSENLGRSFNFLIGNITIKKQLECIVITVGVYDGELMENTHNKLQLSILESKLALLERIILTSASSYYKKPVKVQYCFITEEFITSSLIVNYIQIKLHQGFSVNEIIFSLKSLLNTTRSILGYRIDFNGRFTRKQRASSLSEKKGQVSFSRRDVKLDYSKGSAVLKYGKCGVKVWLNKEYSNSKINTTSFINESSQF